MTEYAVNSVALGVLARHLAKESDNIIARWQAAVMAAGDASSITSLSRNEFHDHIPQFINRFCAVLRSDADPASRPAKQHGARRWQQGLDFQEVVLEWNLLHRVLFEYVTSTWQTAELDLPSLQQAYWLLADTVQRAIAASLAEFGAFQRLEAEARLHDLEAVSEEHNDLERRRGEGLRQASHDLRGSLQVIRLSCYALRNRQLGEQSSAITERLWHATNGLNQLFNDMLELARLEAGNETYEPSDFDAAELLRELADTMRPLATTRGLLLQDQGDEPLIVRSDRTKIRRIAQNLILNALSYTAAGSVTISWQAEPPHHWSFCIRDTGPGMSATTASALASGIRSASTQPRENTTEETNLFTVSKQPEAHGEGIGLSIVHRLCQLLNAVLEIDTAPDQGTTFNIRLPT